MCTPGPGRTKDVEKKLSYPRSKYTNQQEIALYVSSKETKIKASPYPEVPLAAWLHSWTQFYAGVLFQFARSRMKARNSFFQMQTPASGTQSHWARGQDASCTLSERNVFAQSSVSCKPGSVRDSMNGIHL